LYLSVVISYESGNQAHEERRDEDVATGVRSRLQDAGTGKGVSSEMERA